MARVRREVELAVRLRGQGGDPGEILRVVADSRISVLAHCTYSDREETVVLLVPSDPLRCKDCLEAAGFKSRANPVIIVEARDRVGAAARIGAYLGRSGIEILYSYVAAMAGGESLAVFKTSNDELALGALTNEESLFEAA
jgi:hypothetical protein